MNDFVYRLIIDDLERELMEIDETLLKIEERKTELLQRRFEILIGLDGIKQMMEGRI